MGTDLWRRSVLWLRESPKEYTPAAPLLITTLAHSACQTVFGGRNPGKWTAVMRACIADAINVVLVFETSRYAGAECSFNYLQNAAFSFSLLTIRTNRRASRKPRMPSPQPANGQQPEKWPIQAPAHSDVSWSSSFLVSFASS
jgi:hypothetical protein